MKAVHLSTTDYGGAYKAAKRISESMKTMGVESKVVVRTKTGQDRNTYEFFDNNLYKFISKCKNLCNLCFSNGLVISDYFGSNVLKNKYVQEADIIFLHWVNSFVSYRIAEKLAESGKKIVWVMHDMWLFTGGCHCDKYCGKYSAGCGNCPMLGSKRKSDISSRNFLRKKKMMQSGIIKIVGPSKWLIKCARESDILRNCTIDCIFNPIDSNIFQPIDVSFETKRKYGLNLSKKIILYGAVNSTQDKNKGSQYLLEALQHLDKEKYMLIVFGNKPGYEMETGEIETKYLGYIYDENELALVYNLADVFVAPSEQESFGYTVGEALFCGTPVAAFSIGGINDQVEHKKNGYLARPYDTEDLRCGIEYCTDCLKVVYPIIDLSYESIGKKYINL